jgi:Fur family transcriptional regulator, ferric uptake regulator
MNKSDLKLIAVLERTGGFASAQELHQILRREGDGIGLTTVYRALQSLVDDKIVIFCVAKMAKLFTVFAVMAIIII